MTMTGVDAAGRSGGVCGELVVGCGDLAGRRRQVFVAGDRVGVVMIVPPGGVAVLSTMEAARLSAVLTASTPAAPATHPGPS